MGWLTRQQLLDAIAIRQFTPGPIQTTATLKLGHGFVKDWSAIILMALRILMTFKSPKISSFWVIVAGALFGYGIMMVEYDYIAD